MIPSIHAERMRLAGHILTAIYSPDPDLVCLNFHGGILASGGAIWKHFFAKIVGAIAPRPTKTATSYYETHGQRR